MLCLLTSKPRKDKPVISEPPSRLLRTMNSGQSTRHLRLWAWNRALLVFRPMGITIMVCHSLNWATVFPSLSYHRGSATVLIILWPVLCHSWAIIILLQSSWITFMNLLSSSSLLLPSSSTICHFTSTWKTQQRTSYNRRQMWQRCMMHPPMSTWSGPLFAFRLAIILYFFFSFLQCSSIACTVLTQYVCFTLGLAIWKRVL